MTVEVDADELSEAGYHHYEDCPPYDAGPALAEMMDGMRRHSAQEVHQVLHGSGEPAACNREPCRSYPIDLLLTPMGRVR